ncbi:hypothetical protein V6N13_016031 [Hibiscus sabdariffa]
MRFEDNIQFKETVKKYSIAKGVKLRFLKNEPLRTRVCCKEKCPWKLYASHDKRFDCYVLKTYNPMHKCYRSNENTMLSCKMIKKKFRDRILMEPKMKISTLQEMCKSELEVYATYSMYQRAKSDVLKEKQGALKQGWIEGCRPFIGVDGCFLKTVSKGALLVAIGRDRNNQMFSVAWAVVEGEGKES